ncbi:MAG: hypothetical protein AAF519_07865 [Bacteroidota bacterium]
MASSELTKDAYERLLSSEILSISNATRRAIFISNSHCSKCIKKAIEFDQSSKNDILYILDFKSKLQAKSYFSDGKFPDNFHLSEEFAKILNQNHARFPLIFENITESGCDITVVDDNFNE